MFERGSLLWSHFSFYFISFYIFTLLCSPPSHFPFFICFQFIRNCIFFMSFRMQNWNISIYIWSGGVELCCSNSLGSNSANSNNARINTLRKKIYDGYRLFFIEYFLCCCFSYMCILFDLIQYYFVCFISYLLKH